MAARHGPARVPRKASCRCPGHPRGGRGSPRGRSTHPSLEASSSAMAVARWSGADSGGGAAVAVAGSAARDSATAAAPAITGSSLSYCLPPPARPLLRHPRGAAHSPERRLGGPAVPAAPGACVGARWVLGTVPCDRERIPGAPQPAARGVAAAKLPLVGS